MPQRRPSGWADGRCHWMDRAKEVLKELAHRGIGERPIAFICHSLGGLLAKQLLHTGARRGNPPGARSHRQMAQSPSSGRRTQEPLGTRAAPARLDGRDEPRSTTSALTHRRCAISMVRTGHLPNGIASGPFATTRPTRRVRGRYGRIPRVMVVGRRRPTLNRRRRVRSRSTPTTCPSASPQRRDQALRSRLQRSSAIWSPSAAEQQLRLMDPLSMRVRPPASGPPGFRGARQEDRATQSDSHRGRRPGCGDRDWRHGRHRQDRRSPSTSLICWQSAGAGRAVFVDMGGPTGTPFAAVEPEARTAHRWSRSEAMIKVVAALEPEKAGAEGGGRGAAQAYRSDSRRQAGPAAARQRREQRPQVRPLLDWRAPTTMVVITSRRTITAPGLVPGRDTIDLDVMEPDEAADLLRTLLGTRAASEAELALDRRHAAGGCRSRCEPPALCSPPIRRRGSIRLARARSPTRGSDCAT